MRCGLGRRKMKIHPEKTPRPTKRRHDRDVVGMNYKELHIYVLGEGRQKLSYRYLFASYVRTYDTKGQTG